MTNGKKQNRREILLQAFLLKRKRKKELSISAKMLAERISKKQSEAQQRQITVSQSAISRVENGDFCGLIKHYMVLELFGSEENFKKRVSDEKYRLRSKRLPSANEGQEHYNLIETSIAQSHTTLNNFEVRKAILFRFGKESAIERSLKLKRVCDGEVKKILNEIRSLFDVFNKWHEINEKLLKSEQFYNTEAVKSKIDELKKLKPEYPDFERSEKKLKSWLKMQSRIKQVYGIDTYPDYKSVFANYRGKHGKFFIREFLLQLYKVFKSRGASQEEAIKLTYDTSFDFLNPRRKSKFIKYRYFADIFDVEKVEVRNKDELQFNIILVNMIEEAIRNSPKKSKTYRYSLKDFMYLFVPSQQKTKSTSN